MVMLMFNHITPVMYTDYSGEFPCLISLAIVAYVGWAVVDIITVAKGEIHYDEENAEIVNSYKVQNPTIILGYSIYLKYFSDNKGYFEGSAGGIAGEWIAHNILYDSLYIPNKLGLVDDDYLNSAMYAGIGRSIFDEHDLGLQNDNLDRMAVFVISFAAETNVSPASSAYDIYLYITKGLRRK